MNIYLDSIGCRLNQSEIESYGGQFRAAGHTLVEHPEQADLVVVNTCAVTGAAASDSRQKIRQVARAGAGQVVVTGCWSTLFPGEARILPGVVQIIPNASKDNLVAEVLHVPPETFDREFVEREPIPGARLRTRAFVKVQDGCDNRCTFCVTTLARGPGRSRPMEAVLADVRAALQGGAQEIVLTGVHLGSWGKDLEPASQLKSLVHALLGESRVPRLRLSSLEPWDLSADFFELWQDQRLCRHLHLPLQSGCARTLRRMARKITPQSFQSLVTAARSTIPDLAITTDVIVGFPGETEAEYNESLNFVRQIGFSGGHVFTYSPRPGTAAAKMPDQVPHAVAKVRSAQMRLALDESAAAYRGQFLDQEVSVLWESATRLGPEGWEVSGLTDNYLRISSLAPQRLWNRITPVRLTEITSEGLFGFIRL